MEAVAWDSLDEAERRDLLRRPAALRQQSVDDAVRKIFDDVARRGDAALLEATQRFDGVELRSLRVPESEIAAAVKSLDSRLADAMRLAIENIRTFHAEQRPKDYQTETMPGVRCAQVWRGLGCVGLYVPGGSAPLFSSLLMQAIPAQIAGCERIVICSPPDRATGRVADVVLAAAGICGCSEIYTLGGAQAIAALSLGTQTLPKADKIFGPGNAYVTRAKEYAAQLDGGPAIDMPAGPSEVMVIADEAAKPEWVAADLLAQAEHDADAQVILVALSPSFIESVEICLRQQLATLPREAIARASVENAKAVFVRDLQKAVEVANLYAPEHLIVQCADAARWLPAIKNAGSVFLGAFTPETAGDYASGTNHVLPTGGRSRTYSGLSVFSFMKSMTVQTLDDQGIAALAPHLAALARAEGLEAHARAALWRVEKQP